MQVLDDLAVGSVLIPSKLLASKQQFHFRADPNSPQAFLNGP